MKFQVRRNTFFKIVFSRWSVWGNLFFRWYDLWVGAYYDRENCFLYVCPFPTIGIRITLRRHLTDGQLWDVLAGHAGEAERLAALDPLALVSEVLSIDEIAEHQHVIELLDRVSPGWEHAELRKAA